MILKTISHLNNAFKFSFFVLFMDVLAWKKRVVNKERRNEEIKFEIYVFKNPKISAPKNEGECYCIDTVDFNYKEWEIINESLSEKPKEMLKGIGFHESCFCYLNGKTLNFNEISKKIGIEKKYLETILFDYKSV